MELKATLIGRDSELHTIETMIEGLDEGGAALLIQGAPGIGKSALMIEAERRVGGRDWLVLKATGVQSETHMPFAGLHQLLRPILAGDDELPESQRKALRAAFGAAGEDAPDLFLVALSTLGLLADAAARQPILILAEDAHWLDPETCEVLAFVGRRLESDPILLLISRRNCAGPIDGMALPALALDPLDDEGAAAVLDLHSTDLPLAVRGRLLREARGNPLALVELPRAWRASSDGRLQLDGLPLTARLEHAFAGRARALPGPTRALLLVAALNDREDLRETLTAAGSLAGVAVGAVDLAPATAALLVDADEATLSFRHPLVRSAIRQAATLSERSAAHVALASVVGDDPDRAVWHRAAATVGSDEDVAAGLEAAATRAASRGALAAAAAALERAAQLTANRERVGGRLLQAAQIAVELGQREMAARLLREAGQDDLTPLDRARQALIVEMLDPGSEGDPARVLALVEAANRALVSGDPDLALNLLAAAASNSYRAGRSYETHDAILAVAEKVPVDQADARLLSVLAYVAPPEDVAEVIARLSAWDPESSSDDASTQLIGNAAFAVGAHAIALRMLTVAIDGLRRQGRLVLLAQALVQRAWCQIHLSHWKSALSDAQEASRLAKETAQPIWEADAQVAEGILAGLRGDEATAMELAAMAERVVLPAGNAAVQGVVQLTRGVAALGVGRYDEAYHHLRRMLDPSDAAHHRHNDYWAIGFLADAAARTGRGDEARQLLAALEGRLAVTPSPLFRDVMGHARAVLADGDQAEAAFQQALHADTWLGPFSRARLQLAYGTWLRRRRRVAEARIPLRNARDTFDALEATTWGDVARRELRATGEAGRGRVVDVRDQLTPQELQIATMAAAGLSNRDIGQSLYLSHRTIGSHLYRIFPKLGVTSRSELRDALAARDRSQSQSSDSTVRLRTAVA
jgi:DNA-binding NarL/FixJ family response regulator